MPHIDFSYDLGLTGKERSGFHNELIACLSAIDRERSLAKAAKALNLSYRTLWGKIEYWESILGQKLIVRDQGKSSQPSELGRKLLWAERTVQAKNALVIEQLRAQFESVFSQACDPQASLISIAGCFDRWLSGLPPAVAASGMRDLVLDMQFSTSQEGLVSLKERRCDIAGFNLPRNAPATSSFAQAFGPYIDPNAIDGVILAVRTQGLATAAGNPLKLNSLIDVARKKARYANRSASSSTGLLFLELLSQAGLRKEDICGFDRIEPSHAAVATSIASGAADAGLCEELSARKLGLDFTALVYEYYYLVWNKDRFVTESDKRSLETLIGFLKSQEWKKTGEALAGYTVDKCGEAIDPKTEWPWKFE